VQLQIEPEALVAAVWAALSVFVVWVAAVRGTSRWLARRRVAQSLETQVPEPTPEEILEAQRLGLIPPGQPPSSMS